MNTNKPGPGAPGTTEQWPRWEGPEETRPRGYLPAKDDPKKDRDAVGENLRDPHRGKLSHALKQKGDSADEVRRSMRNREAGPNKSPPNAGTERRLRGLAHVIPQQGKEKEMVNRQGWWRDDPSRRYRTSDRDWYGDEDDWRRSRRYREDANPWEAGYERSEYFPDAEPGRAGPYRRMGEDYDWRERERAFRDYHGPGYGYRRGYSPGSYHSSYSSRYPYRDDGYRSREYDRDYDRDYEERGFFERASDEVASWFGDEDAERRRRMDQYRGRGPKGYTRSDDRIQEDVSDRLSDDGALDASDIEVSVANGEVRLSGFVDSKWAKRRAEDCAEDVSGVSNVQNNIRVRGSETEQSYIGTESTG